jgi:hypothetical protein
MASPVWTTPRNLGIAEENSYLEFQFSAVSDTLSISYSFVSGNLATGLAVTHTGLLVGVPVALSDSDYSSEFTVRATDDHGQITDRTFTLLVSAVEPPTITTTAYQLGSYYDGDMLKYQLDARDDNPVGSLSWKLAYGKLPPGVTLTTSGLLEGYLYKNHNRPLEYDIGSIGWDNTIWDKQNFDDLVGANFYTDYQFTAEVSDGIQQSRRSFMLRVYSQDALTADGIDADVSASEDIDLNITVDNIDEHLPFIDNVNGPLTQIRTGVAREHSNFAFKFNGMDIDNDPVNYTITSPDDRGFDQDGDTGFDSDVFDGSTYPMPVQMGLDHDTGWYTGKLQPQVLHEKNYTFQVYPGKTKLAKPAGYRQTVNLRVLGSYSQTIKWVTDSNLGSIDNGSVSGLSVRAVSTLGARLTYRIKPNTNSRTPQGIILTSSGMLTGRASFKHFNIDSATTTFDNNSTTVDYAYTFTVIAETEDKSAYEERTFILVVNQVNDKPYENLYLNGFPNIAQRHLFDDLMSSQDIFPPDLIYRPTDPWFGKAKNLKFLFMSGLNTVDLQNYYTALSRNHYTKTVMLGDIRVAYALDDRYNVIYEVVYLDVIDELEGHDPVTGDLAYPAQTINLVGSRKNFYVDNGVTYTELTPNGLGNMRKQISDTIGVYNNTVLPQWMTCIQPDDNNPGKFLHPIGYVPAVVLAYTVPGAGKLIAYRLAQAKFNFNRIEFSTDRYLLDDYLSSNYDLTTDKFVNGSETTFDSPITKFDDRGTRFFSNVDQYSAPETKAKYIKFTKFGEFV